jgi:hypothetical protein
MEKLVDGLFRVLDPGAILAIVLLCLELLQEAETRRSGRVPRSAVLCHAETLLAALRHLITNESCAPNLSPREAANWAKLHAVRRSHDQVRKDSPNRQKARGGDGQFARTVCCSAAYPAIQHAGADVRRRGFESGERYLRSPRQVCPEFKVSVA